MRLKGTEALFALLSKASNRRLVEALTDTGVEFVIIGGVALAYYGFRDPFEVDDLDLLLEANKRTAEAVTSTLSALIPHSLVLESTIRPGTKLMLRDTFYADLIFAETTERALDIINGSTLVTDGGTRLRLASVDRLRIMKEQVIKEFREQLRKLERDTKEFQEKLEKHERDLDALKAA